MTSQTTAAELKDPASLQVRAIPIEISPDQQEDKCPRLVSLDIKPSTDGSGYASLDLSIEFSEHTSGMTGGWVRFYLKRAELQFKLSNCQMAVEDRVSISQFETKVTVSREVTSDLNKQSTQENGTHMSGAISLGARATGTFKGAQTHKDGTAIGEKRVILDKFNTEVFLIKSGGGPKSPHWIFTPATGGDRLSGSNKERFWGLLEFKPLPAALEATVVLAPDDIGAVPVGGLWPRSMGDKVNRIFRGLAFRQLDFDKFISRKCFSFFDTAVGAV